LSLGVKFSVRPTILLNSRECSSLGVNEGVNILPREQSLPRGATILLKTGLWVARFFRVQHTNAGKICAPNDYNTYYVGSCP
jgi:hypothetical protein